jgi:hypothetical protein
MERKTKEEFRSSEVGERWSENAILTQRRKGRTRGDRNLEKIAKTGFLTEVNEGFDVSSAERKRRF